ncbi:MAG: glucokinase [Telmatospirillum sp.]|nr:glucokinase [Telmatospirillum sp.]
MEETSGEHPEDDVGLIADIGGTNARFSLVRSGTDAPLRSATLPCADFTGPAEAARAFLAGAETRPRKGAFAIACPVLGDEVSFTNLSWRFSIEELRRSLTLDRLTVVNDFTAVALSVPLLGEEDRLAVGSGRASPEAPIAILGPGTGLGVGALIPSGGGWIPIATEGGHVTMAAATEREARVLGWLRDRIGHVSAERVLSGPGLVNLHRAIGSLEGRPPADIAPKDVAALAADGDKVAAEAQAMFFSMLGTFAGNLALSSGARGGVIIAGGVIAHMLDAFLASGFRHRFEDKGRFRSYLEQIPVHLVTHPYPAFVGLKGLVA